MIVFVWLLCFLGTNIPYIPSKSKSIYNQNSVAAFPPLESFETHPSRLAPTNQLQQQTNLINGCQSPNPAESPYKSDFVFLLDVIFKFPRNTEVRDFHNASCTWKKGWVMSLGLRSFSGPLLEDALKRRGRPQCSYRTFMNVHHETAK